MITIRSASHADLGEILQIYNEIIINTTAVYDYEPHTLDMRRVWLETKQKDNYPVFVATDNEKVIGFSSLGPFRSWAAYKFTVENSIYLSPECRGKGIGKLLLEPLITSASALKMHAIVSAIDAGNLASLRLHESCGFREVAHFKEVGFKFNRWLDLKFLELLLPDKTPALH